MITESSHDHPHRARKFCEQFGAIKTPRWSAHMASAVQGAFDGRLTVAICVCCASSAARTLFNFVEEGYALHDIGHRDDSSAVATTRSFGAFQGPGKHPDDATAAGITFGRSARTPTNETGVSISSR